MERVRVTIIVNGQKVEMEGPLAPVWRIREAAGAKRGSPVYKVNAKGKLYVPELEFIAVGDGDAFEVTV